MTWGIIYIYKTNYLQCVRSNYFVKWKARNSDNKYNFSKSQLSLTVDAKAQESHSGNHHRHHWFKPVPSANTRWASWNVFQYPYHLTIKYAGERFIMSQSVKCSMPELPGCSLTCSWILQYTSQHTLLAILTHNPLCSGKFITYVTLCHSDTKLRQMTDDWQSDKCHNDRWQRI